MKLKQTLFLLTFTFATLTFALQSPFPSTVAGLTTPNSHKMEYGNERVYRGQAPRNLEEFKQLKKFGFTDVLIFKKQTRTEVDEEKKTLKKLGYKGAQVHHIPFKWKDLDNFREACEQTLQGLRLLVKVEKSTDRKVFFHCTVGEDRTGYLAGLYELLHKVDKVQHTFRDEMCQKGFGMGNPNKPVQPVVMPIRASLTPLYLKMAYKIKYGYLRLDYLNSKQCEHDPANFDEFKTANDFKMDGFKCENTKIPKKSNHG